MTAKFLTTPRYTFIASSIALALSSSVLANEETITVWGAQVSTNSEYLADQDIAIKQADHLSDLLRDLPGVDVGGSHTVTQKINIRGITEKDLDIRLDGAPQSGEMFHHVSVLTLNPDILKSVDIQVGANSVTSGGVGGSVRFETKEAQDLLDYDQNFGAIISAGAGSNRYLNGSITAFGQLSETIDALAYVHTFSRDNHKDGFGEEKYGFDGDVSNGLVKFGWQANEKHRFDLSYDHYVDQGDYAYRPDMGVAYNNQNGLKEVAPVDYSRSTATLNYEYDSNAARIVKVTTYYNLADLERDESKFSKWPDTRKFLVDGEIENIGASLLWQEKQQLWSLNHTFVSGAEFNIQSTSQKIGSAAAREEKLSTEAVYFEDTIAFGDFASLTPGLRYDQYHREQYTRNERHEKNLSMALAGQISPTDFLNLYASTRELFKNPSLCEAMAYCAANDANDLKPEKGLNSEVGFRLHNDHSNSELKAAAQVNFFKTELEDKVLYQNGETFNAGEMAYDGFEVSTNITWKGLFTSLSYSRTDVEYPKEMATTNQPYFRSASIGDSINFSSSYDFETVDLTIEWNSQFVLEEDNVLSGKTKPSYNVHDIQANWLIADSLNLIFGIDNIFDETYYSHASTSGFVSWGKVDMEDFEPGRNIKLSASYKF